MLSFIKGLIVHIVYTSKMISRKAAIIRKSREERYLQFQEIINADEKHPSAGAGECNEFMNSFFEDIIEKLGLASTDEIDQLKMKIDALYGRIEELSRNH